MLAFGHDLTKVREAMFTRLATVVSLLVATALAGQAQTTPSPPTGTTEKEFATLRDQCAKEWPENFRMRNFCEEQQIEALRKLKSRGSIERR
jgi:hypothetical protein